MRQLLPALAAIPLVVAFGVAEGRWSGRWVNDEAVARAAARLQTIPLSFGDWVGEENSLDSRQVEKAELAGHLMRRYMHKSSGAELSLLLVCGRSGPVSLHPPDVCYGGIGFNLAGPPARQPVAEGQSAFKLGRFQNVAGPVPEYLRILWAWSPDGRTWSAPDNPRVTFAAAPALYKLYIVRHVASLADEADSDPGLVFLKQFLPLAEKSLAANE
jgi:hypothetical protein